MFNIQLISIQFYLFSAKMTANVLRLETSKTQHFTKTLLLLPGVGCGHKTILVCFYNVTIPVIDIILMLVLVTNEYKTL